MNKEVITYDINNGISITRDNIPASFPEHWHNDAEFTLIMKNGCRYKIKDEIITPEAGDIIMVWPRELHEIVQAPEDGFIFIQFSSSLIESNMDLFSMSRFFREYHHISAQKEPELAGSIAENIRKISDIFSKNPYFAETRSKQLVYDSLILIGDHVISKQHDMISTDMLTDKARSYIRIACSFIYNHSTDNITQTDVAEKVGLSPYYFSKLFNEYTDMSFPAYLSSIRVQNAINLLANENLTITECAFLSGFQSTTTFNKQFLDITGCTPRKYRKMHRVGY